MNRIGLHITNGTRLPLRGPHGRPRVVTLLDCSPEYHRQVREEVGPECLICTRLYQRDQPLDNPEADADRWWGQRCKTAHCPIERRR